MKRTILIAQDDSLQAIFEPEEYNVFHVASVDQMLTTAAANRIDAFILDGIGFCRAIRSFDRRRSTPVIFLTDNEQTIDDALSSGADDFIVKPASPSVVRARLKTHFQRAENSRQAEWLRSVLERYLPKRTLDMIESASATGTLPPPQEQDLAICFTDMRGFTAFSEETEPSRLFSIVSAFLADQVQIIHEFGGYVDKFGGDGVMAIFDGPEMVAQSCLCALSILESARVKGGGLSGDMRGFGVGIHTGRAVVGNIGSPEHLDYSAIGSAVNLAARLCGQAEAMSVVVSKAVRDALAGDPRVTFHSERNVPIRGIKDAVTVYTLGRGR
jgi:adenylate cyclase